MHPATTSVPAYQPDKETKIRTASTPSQRLQVWLNHSQPSATDSLQHTVLIPKIRPEGPQWAEDCRPIPDRTPPVRAAIGTHTAGNGPGERHLSGQRWKDANPLLRCCNGLNTQVFPSQSWSWAPVQFSACGAPAAAGVPRLEAVAGRCRSICPAARERSPGWKRNGSSGAWSVFVANSNPLNHRRLAQAREVGPCWAVPLP